MREKKRQTMADAEDEKYLTRTLATIPSNVRSQFLSNDFCIPYISLRR